MGEKPAPAILLYWRQRLSVGDTTDPPDCPMLGCFRRAVGRDRVGRSGLLRDGVYA